MKNSVSKKKHELDKEKKTEVNVNRGQHIYFRNELHYIVYEFDDNSIISKNKDFSRAFCVKRKHLSVNPKNK